MFGFYLSQNSGDYRATVSIVIRPNNMFSETCEFQYDIRMDDFVRHDFRPEIDRMGRMVAREMIRLLPIAESDEPYLHRRFVSEFTDFLEQRGFRTSVNMYGRSPIRELYDRGPMSRDMLFYPAVTMGFVEEKKEQPPEKFKEMGRTPLVKEILTETEQASKEYVKDKLKEAIASIR